MLKTDCKYCQNYEIRLMTSNFPLLATLIFIYLNKLNLFLSGRSKHKYWTAVNFFSSNIPFAVVESSILKILFTIKN